MEQNKEPKWKLLTTETRVPGSCNPSALSNSLLSFSLSRKSNHHFRDFHLSTCGTGVALLSVGGGGGEGAKTTLLSLSLSHCTECKDFFVGSLVGAAKWVTVC